MTEQAHGGKLSVFNGPIFRPNDRVHRGVPIPREFYRLIVYAKEPGKAGAVAFILSQQSLIKNLPAEEFEVGTVSAISGEDQRPAVAHQAQFRRPRELRSTGRGRSRDVDGRRNRRCGRDEALRDIVL